MSASIAPAYVVHDTRNVPYSAWGRKARREGGGLYYHARGTSPDRECLSSHPLIRSVPEHAQNSAASVVALAACNNATSIEKRLVKAGFTVEGGYVGDSQDAEMPEGLQWYLSAERVNQLTMTEDYVAVYCFEKAAQAKSYASLIKREAGMDQSMQIEVKGKLIFVGTKNGVEAAM